VRNQLFDDFENVARKNDSGIVFDHFIEQLPEITRSLRIETIEGFVENQQLWRMYDNRSERYFFLHAKAVVGGIFVGGLRKAKKAQQFFYTLFSGIPG
jgi:hypothetical protein